MKHIINEDVSKFLCWAKFVADELFAVSALIALNSIYLAQERLGHG